MNKVVLLALAAVGTMFTAGTASAQVIYYSGPGYGVHIEPRYERDYDERRYRDHDYYDERRYRDHDYYERHNYRAARCPPSYTVQDGVCKPYRGY